VKTSDVAPSRRLSCPSAACIQHNQHLHSGMGRGGCDEAPQTFPHARPHLGEDKAVVGEHLVARPPDELVHLIHLLLLRAVEEARGHARVHAGQELEHIPVHAGRGTRHERYATQALCNTCHAGERGTRNATPRTGEGRRCTTWS